jgi:hypothetical protein
MRQALRHLSGVTWALLTAPLILLLLVGFSVLTVGLFLGSMTVAGIWLTVEQVPGVRALGRTRVGMVLLSLAAALAVHLVIGTSSIVGMVAAATALVLKYFLLASEARVPKYTSAA